MVKIILDDEMSDYISRVFNSEIKAIYLDSRLEDIKREFGYFMKELLSRREFTNVRQPYIYDTKSKILGIGKYDDYLDGCSIQDKIHRIYEQIMTDKMSAADYEKIEDTMRSATKAKTILIKEEEK